MPDKIFVAGHNGMVGQAVCRRLKKENITFLTATRVELDLINQVAVNEWFEKHKPDKIYLCAARVGGIQANLFYPADFIYQNLMIAANIIHAAYVHGVKKLLFLGSSCIYPRDCDQPMREELLFSGAFEPTNEAYAIAKMSGVKMCQFYRMQYGCDFISAIPCNLYGHGDNFHPENAHVPAALLSRFHKAKINDDKSVVIWGTGAPQREFMHVDDAADGLVFLMNHYSDDFPINLGTGDGISIQNFASLLSNIIGFKGSIKNDLSKPDGMPIKIMDVSKIKSIGWQAKISLEDGLKNYYHWYISNQNFLRHAA
jgi:GDP-L-fucose synthase